jgi:hypothetical protein
VIVAVIVIETDANTALGCLHHVCVCVCGGGQCYQHFGATCSLQFQGQCV